jgi:hypothetical protein
MKVTAVVSKIVISLMVAMAMPVAATPLSARTCILSNVASEKACKPRCCANKKCCETSEKNRATPSQPLAKSGADQSNIVASPSAVAVVGIDQALSAKPFFYLSRNSSSHFQATLAFICIRLI